MGTHKLVLKGSDLLPEGMSASLNRVPARPISVILANLRFLIEPDIR